MWSSKTDAAPEEDWDALAAESLPVLFSTLADVAAALHHRTTAVR